MKRMVLALLLVVVMIGPLFAGGQEEKKPATLTKLTVISPRGSLEVMDDYLLWVALDMGYFKDQGLDIDMEPGPTTALPARSSSTRTRPTSATRHRAS